MYDEKDLSAQNTQDGENIFTDNPNLIYLSTEDSDVLDLDLDEDEIYIAVKSLNNGSAPGPDGIPAEFYKIFWPDVSFYLMKSFNYSYEQKILSPTQRQGIIKLLHKGKDLSRDELENWRPISLTNTDYKILSKTLSNRLKNVLNKLIHQNQHGFVKGRNICTMIRELDDIIEHQRDHNAHSILLSVDYKKCFDTITTKSIITAAKTFRIGDNFIRWIETLLHKRVSCVSNGGNISREFELKRGVRQGCPISPLRFILTVELFACNIRNDPNIKGISISNGTISSKILQFADDTTLLLKDLIDFREILSKIKLFSYFSGLELNKNKSIAMCLSNNCHYYGTQQFDIRFEEKVKIVGVYFSSKKSASNIKENWEQRIEDLEKMCGRWSRRNPSILGKITLLKAFGLSKFIYVMQSIGLNDEVLTRINRIFFRFLWKKKFSNRRAFEKVRRQTMYNSYSRGGLHMINIQEYQDSFILQWAENLLINDDASWKNIPNTLLKKVGGINIFKAGITLKELKGLENVKNEFWKRVLTTWLKLNHNNPINNFILPEDPLFNNPKIRIGQNVLHIPSCISKGILHVGDVLDQNNLFMTFQEYEQKWGSYPRAFLDYNILKAAISKRVLQTPGNPDDHTPRFRDTELGNLKAKGFRSLLHEDTEPHATSIWNRKFNTQITEGHWLVAINSTKETRLRTLHWKIVSNIYPTAILLQKMGLRETNKCPSCLEVDYIEHFFYECREVQELWKEVERLVETETSHRCRLNAENVLLGIVSHQTLSQKDLKLYNHAILVAKMTISKFKYGTKYNLVEMFRKEASLRKIFDSKFN
ncbi:MAG: reverse transcriptase family protein [Chlamydiota bacterium]|nr:reverse transcriptase family protein [Chlamydiota bacterium]